MRMCAPKTERSFGGRREWATSSLIPGRSSTRAQQTIACHTYNTCCTYTCTCCMFVHTSADVFDALQPAWIPSVIVRIIL